MTTRRQEQDRQVLLASIRENPDDDRHRLAFAQWLETDGEGPADRDRAEFIRAQVLAATLKDGDEQRKEVERRADGLLAAHREE